MNLKQTVMWAVELFGWIYIMFFAIELIYKSLTGQTFFSTLFETIKQGDLLIGLCLAFIIYKYRVKHKSKLGAI